MSQSSIEWTQWTSNPIGIKGSLASYCVKVSPGCKHCYAEIMSRRLAAISHDRGWVPYKKMEVPPELELRQKVLDQWVKWKKPHLVFVSSMSDVFGEFVPPVWIFKILDAMCASPLQIFQVLTKRGELAKVNIDNYCAMKGIKHLPVNIWIGVSVEDQERANERIPYLLRTKCMTRFLSCEPLLGRLDLTDIILPEEYKDAPVEHVNCLTTYDDTFFLNKRVGIDQVIVGGESGPGARPMHPDWVRKIKDDCKEYKVPIFFKQWGAWVPWEADAQPPFNRSQNGGYIDGHAMPSLDEMEDSKKWDVGYWCIESGDNLCLFEKVGKYKSGNLLDGVQYQEMPEIYHALKDNISGAS